MSKKTPTELLTEIRLSKEQIEQLKMEAGEDAMEFRALQRKYKALEQRSVGLEAELKSKAAEIANKDAIISQLEIDRQVAADAATPELDDADCPKSAQKDQRMIAELSNLLKHERRENTEQDVMIQDFIAGNEQALGPYIEGTPS